jgi:hypothetical protein
MLPLLQKQHALYHPMVVLDARTCCDYGHFQELVREQLGLTRAPGTPPERLRAIGRRLVAFTEALAACPLAPGEPEATIAAVLARDPAPLFAPPDEARVNAGRTILAGIAGELLERASTAIASALSRSALGARLAREIAQLLHLVEATTAPGAELDEYYREIASQRLAEPADVDEVLTISMRQQLFGHAVLLQDRALAGLLRMAFIQLLTLAGARLRATVEDRRGVVADDLSYGHMLATRVLDLRGMEAVFIEHEADAPAALEALPSAAGWG